MPKDEFDPADPLELNGVTLRTEQDTTDVMAECLVEEFLRLGRSAPEILALFCNPYYVGTHMILQQQGEPYVREVIRRVFARWGRPCAWPDPQSGSASANAAPEPLAHQPNLKSSNQT